MNKNAFTKHDFNELVRFLRKSGYSVNVCEIFSFNFPHKVEGLFATFNGKGTIKGGFVWTKQLNCSCYSTLKNKLAADCEFDKWSSCPMVVNLPFSHENLLKQLKYLRSNDSHERSNSFERGYGILNYDMP